MLLSSISSSTNFHIYLYGKIFSTSSSYRLTYLMKKMFMSLPFLLLEVNKMELGPTKPEYAKSFFLSDHKYVCASIQFNYGWSLKVYRKSCELMLRICCQQLSHSPFFLEKKPLKNVRSIQILQDCQMFIIVFVKTSVNHFFSGFIFPLKKITSITISRVVQPNI